MSRSYFSVFFFNIKPFKGSRFPFISFSFFFLSLQNIPRSSRINTLIVIEYFQLYKYPNNKLFRKFLMSSPYELCTCYACLRNKHGIHNEYIIQSKVFVFNFPRIICGFTDLFSEIAEAITFTVHASTVILRNVV